MTSIAPHHWHLSSMKMSTDLHMLVFKPQDKCQVREARSFITMIIILILCTPPVNK